MPNNVSSFKKYCNSLTAYSRYPTREVNIGGIPLGNFHPIRIQSMTTTDTMNTIATVGQTIRMVNAGCDYVRITAPSIDEAKNLLEIKKELKARGYSVPLIADIHFTPNAAEVAARIVEKVRVNPGNYADKKRFDVLEYSDLEYEAELDRIRKKFTPLVKICKEYGTAMRIGTNHGSLSDRIMSRFGDNPQGMVESALEFVRMCRELNYHDIVLSMKASNTQVMVQAYRLLINRMEEEGMDYPLHLGVTEAGDGEDGRIKSAVGIGTLLEDGIGDTVRVSLTEEPEYEPPVAIALVSRYEGRSSHAPIPSIETNPLEPFSYSRRKTFPLLNLGGSNVPRVVADYSHTALSNPSQLNPAGYFYNAETDKWSMTDIAADYIFVEGSIGFELPGGLRVLYRYDAPPPVDSPNCYPVVPASDFFGSDIWNGVFAFVLCGLRDLSPERLQLLENNRSAVLVLHSDNLHTMPEIRRAFIELINAGIQNPCFVKISYNDTNNDDLLLKAATDFGGLLLDGLCDGIWLNTDASPYPAEVVNRASFGILQAARTRITKTEYIACPSCGRTLFDLVETTDRIRRRTSHLKGVKIAIMGCIVNGPGEMADADFGYVGSGPGKITLYRGKEVVKKNITSDTAVDELIELIRSAGAWVDPPAQN